MFSSIARAFSNQAALRPAFAATRGSCLSRYMTSSTSTDQDETSVVDVCKKKIQDALGENVKVTGEFG